MDHTEATQLIDGQFEQIFAVRDLASHRQLAWVTVRSTDAEEACQVLEQLLAEHGPPLVLKSDQGSAFTGQAMADLLARWQVTPLFSPKRMPQYNGALERSNSTHKTYTHQHAVIEGHACYWTTEDLAAAQKLANTITRPWGHAGPSPDEAWQQRTPLTAEERRAFDQEVHRQQAVARDRLGMQAFDVPTALQQDRLERLAASAALESLGYLTKHPVTRPPRKRKRPRGAAWQRELKQHREQALPLSANDCDECNRIDSSMVRSPGSSKRRDTPQFSL